MLENTYTIAVLYPPRDNPYGIHGMGGGLQKFQMESMEWGMDSILFPWNGGWTPYIFKMDSMEWGMDSMNLGMDSILFKDGFHEMGDGFHGMGDGLHTFLRWIPWNGGWIPYFFRMDSMEWGMDSILF